MLDLRAHILVVDDQQLIRELAKYSLGQLGYQRVTAVSSVRRAMAELEIKPVHLILSDINMEGMTGLEFLARVKQHPRYKKIPFVLVTGEANMENVKAAKKYGAANFLVKPFTVDSLKAMLSKF